jgi:soluble lytic murein transglycosylase-like protein
MKPARVLVTLCLLVEVAAAASVVREPRPEPAVPVEAPVCPVEAAVPFSARCEKTPPANFDALLEAAAAEFDVDPRVLATTVYRESACDPTVLGSSGEIGLGQVHPKVWASSLVRAGVIRRTKDLWDPRTNLRAAAWILAAVSDAADGDLRDTFRRYNGSGPKARRYAREQVTAFASLWE